jgi:hypothetical protein
MPEISLSSLQEFTESSSAVPHRIHFSHFDTIVRCTSSWYACIHHCVCVCVCVWTTLFTETCHSISSRNWSPPEIISALLQPVSIDQCCKSWIIVVKVKTRQWFGCNVTNSQHTITPLMLQQSCRIILSRVLVTRVIWLDLLHLIHSQLGTRGNTELSPFYTLCSSPLHTQ